MSAPLAIFAYNRPAHLAAMLGTLVRCHGFGNAPITIFCDGAKGAHDLPAVAAVRELVTNLGWDRLELVFHDKNKGLRRSISDGVGAVVARYGRVIVLEDDLRLSPAALDYFNAALDTYADTPQVHSISGYIYDVPELRRRGTAFFLPFALPWGWATWERAWRGFDLNREVAADHLSSPSFRRAFSLNGTANFARMLELACSGRIDSWYLKWYYQIVRDGGISLFPPTTLVANHGFSGGTGTHAGRFNPYSRLVRPHPPAQTPPRLPANICIDYRAMDAIPTSWEARVLRFISTAGMLKRTLKGIPGRAAS